MKRKKIITDYLGKSKNSNCYGALRDLVPFVTLLKVTLLNGCFSRFLNCAHTTKSHNAPQISSQKSKWKKFTKIHTVFFIDYVFNIYRQIKALGNNLPRQFNYHLIFTLIK